jgi:putative ABC transport system ATP-binding protein
MVKAESVRFTYPYGKEFAFPSIDLGDSEHLLILGASGVGKTTYLHLLSGLLPAREGSIVISGTDICGLSRKELDRFRGEHIGIVFQKYRFIQSLNVHQNLSLRQNYPKSDSDPDRLQALCERLGIAGVLDKKVSNLSQGQQQRLSIALGLIHKPRVVFADEPTSNLDDENSERVVELLKEEAGLCGSNLVIVTHDQRVSQHFENRLIL